MKTFLIAATVLMCSYATEATTITLFPDSMTPFICSANLTDAKCCLTFPLNNGEWCANLHRVKSDVTVQFTFNGDQKWKNTIPDSNAKPMCLTVSLIPNINACLNVKSITWEDSTLRICSTIDVKSFSTVLFTIYVECLEIGKNGINFVKPDA